MAADATDRGEQEHSHGDSSSKTSWAQVGDYAQLAFLFPAATVVGWLIGVMLDKWLHTTWLYIVGLLFGIVAGFVELIRTVAKNNRRPPKV
jgi:F0F1-type ATP synthase assembly protein I